MVEEKIYYRCVGENSQRQGHRGESRVDMSHVRRGQRRGRKGIQVRLPGPAERDLPKESRQKDQIIKMVGLYRAGQSRPLA